MRWSVCSCARVSGGPVWWPCPCLWSSALRPPPSVAPPPTIVISMADLDDFFAKKDKKRGAKGGVKAARTVPAQLQPQPAPPPPSDPQVKKPEDSAPVDAAPAQQPAVAPPPPKENNSNKNEDDEWKDFEVAKKDYTGLKIQNLDINSSNAQDSNSDNYNDGDFNNPDNKMKPAWNKNESMQQQQQEIPPPVREVKEDMSRLAPKKDEKASNAYVPPSLRNRPAVVPDSAVRPRYGKTHAPDIHNEELFPTIGNEGRRSVNNAGGAWTSAGGRSAAPSVREPPREVPLENRFTSLRNDS